MQTEDQILYKCLELTKRGMDTEDCDSSYSHIMCDRMVHRWTLLYKNTILMTDKRCTIYLSHPKEIRRHYEEDH